MGTIVTLCTIIEPVINVDTLSTYITAKDHLTFFIPSLIVWKRIEESQRVIVIPISHSLWQESTIDVKVEIASRAVVAKSRPVRETGIASKRIVLFVRWRAEKGERVVWMRLVVDLRWQSEALLVEIEFAIIRLGTTVN
ncbi:hypothetical protein LOK49_LG02G01231 [Camellia lanceoleosa]|uniref:Uncharacterized protein n=1 Tax=Camellia lanceoleosa TaxID=1840588 RepID=A0ACC0IKX6_9ERIC|nr:hypothetical protein LOK49_LG02G01231 [Camellia lanceoleosa]